MPPRWAVLAPYFYQPGGAEQFAHLVARELDAAIYCGETKPAVFDAYPGSEARVRPRPPTVRRTRINTAERVLRNALRRDVDADLLLLSGNYAMYRALFDRRPTLAYLHAPPGDPYGLEGRAARKATALVANAPAVAEAAARVYRRAPDAVVPPP
ncbi:MAG TPA: glycosyltransferase, partial [Candidatus Thermoplasmatota archaeon]|nr:glycosyltransferase [Candidatus Thermoplasmatota archaeon]